MVEATAEAVRRKDAMEKREVFVGVDLGGTNIKVGLVTPNGEVIAENSIPTEADGGVAHVLDRMAGGVRGLMERAKGGVVVRGVGVGSPGQVDVEKGVVREPPNLPGWDEVGLGSALEEMLDLPVVVDNDANVAALAEFAYGAGQGVSEMLMVTLGTGVGGGLILRGKLYRGARGAAGEFGHTIVQQDGPLCGCGRRGCVEAFVGTRGILRRLREQLDAGAVSMLSSIDSKRVMPKDISEAASRGDGVALEVLRETGMYLGVGLGNVANLLNLERVVVGGGVANAGEFILGPARESLARVAHKVSRETIRVVKAALGGWAGIVGAARLAMTESRTGR